jgi:hypothetical protein
MRRIVAGVVVLLLAWPVLADDDKPNDKSKRPAKQTPAQQYQALVEEFDDAQQAFLKYYEEAKTQEERLKVQKEKRPQPDKFAPRFIELAEKNAKDPVALDALVWVLTNTSASGPANKDSPRAKAIALVSRNYVKSDKLGPACQMLGSRGDEKEAETLLRKIIEKNPHREVKGMAWLGLAQMLKRRAERMPDTNAKAREKVQLQHESEQLFDRVIKQYADVRGSSGGIIGEQAMKELFEFEFPRIGKAAPDIKGEDLDGKRFKLSDYKGKVVLLDFWGNW